MKITVKIISLLITICIIASAVPLIALAQDNNPQIIASSQRSLSGNEIEVEISLKNNPGFVSLSLKILYDTDVLNLTSVEDMGVLGENSHKPELNSPYTFVWVNDTAKENFMYNGVIAKLHFTILSDIQADMMSEIQLICNPDNYDVYDKDLNIVNFQTVNGIIDVKSEFAHDLNDDLKCNAYDLIVLRQYLLDVVEFDDNLKLKADFNQDSDIDILDLIILKKLLLSYIA